MCYALVFVVLSLCMRYFMCYVMCDALVRVLFAATDVYDGLCYDLEIK